MLTSRFLFHLQAAQGRASNPQGTTMMSFQDHDGAGTLLFERVIGSLGASILAPRRTDTRTSTTRKEAISQPSSKSLRTSRPRARMRPRSERCRRGYR